MNNTARKIGAAFGLAAIASFSVALPASAANVGEWGVFDDSENGYDGAIYFTNPDFPDAEVMVSSESTYEFLQPAEENEGFTAADPLGALVGANIDSTDTNFLKISTAADNSQILVTEITFNSPVPAGQLVLAISDIDSDHAEITMLDENDEPLIAADILGTATDTGFNWDDPSNTVDVPVVEATDPEVVSMYNAPDGTDGATGWVRPSVAVSKITINSATDDGNVSSQRIWVGQVIEDTSSDDLASTGAGDSLYLGAIVGGALLAAGGAIALRRRQA
jgi:LPXTG-motif cell wall-anchored protein